MRPAELDICADLYLRVLQTTFTWLPPERHRREEFLDQALDEEVFVALEDGVILGLAAFYRPQNFLHSLYVEARGRGLGKALLDHVTAIARGPVSLKVQQPNLRAQAFYLREGFIPLDSGRDGDIAWLRMLRQRP